MGNSSLLSQILKETDREITHFLNIYSEQVINGEASLFVGSGVSRDSGFPSWRSLLEPCAADLGISIDKHSDLYSIAQYYSNRHSDAELRRMFNNAINQITTANPLLESILDLSFNSIWTINYDTLIETELRKRLIGYNVISNDKDLASISKGAKINIYKMNGDVSSPTGMIVTKDDYEHYAKNHPLFLTFLKKELVANTFLFVGYSFSDFVVLDCLRSLNEFLGTSGKCHYAIMLVDNKVTLQDKYFFDDLYKRYNIKCLALKKEQIPILISQIAKKVREKKVFISGSFDTISSAETNFADQLSFELVSRLYENDYRIATGVGKRLGTYITGYAHQYLAEHVVANPSRQLSMRPFPFHLDLEEADKVRYRKSMQADCSAAIFLFGQSRAAVGRTEVPNTGHYSPGVYMEYELAKQANLAIIPVGATGYEAELIWREVKEHINEYYYLSKRIDRLQEERNPAKLAELIISILGDIPKKNRI